MSLLLVVDRPVEETFRTLINEAAPDIEVVIHSEVKRSSDVIVAGAWNHPHGIWRGFPNLRVVTSFGIGADHLLTDHSIPPSVFISRLADPSLSRAMADYVLLAILGHRRGLKRYLAARQEGSWVAPEPAPVDSPIVSVLGLGVMGQEVALALHRKGFSVRGWSKTRDTGLPFPCFAGEDELLTAVKGSNYLVCALPLTPKTEGILSGPLFESLAKGAYLVNVGRGGHLRDDDLIAAISSGVLAGACLDVFHEEPLPSNHPFWKLPAIDITPHIAAKPSRARIVQHLIESYRTVRQGDLPVMVARN